MSTVDVKSLFKSGKKTIKAFKIAAGPATETKSDAKAAEDTMEHWEAPVVSQPAPTVNVGLEEFKADVPEQASKTSVTWTKAAEEPEPVVESKPTSAYVPPSQRRAQAATGDLPTLAELSRASSTTTKPAAAASSGPSGGPTRLKLITAATKKAEEEEAKRKEEEKQKKEAEKQARREQLRAEMMKQPEPVQETPQAEVSTSTIKAAPLDQVFAKYVGRPKNGRKLATTAAA